ncbi:MAG: hypothetical protein K0U39_00890 [Alphaproteobacteria bacterium]|nr:hypothetical protein [Alphaproteobacteria bacterium]
MARILHIHHMVMLVIISLWANMINADPLPKFDGCIPCAKAEYAYYGHAYNSDSSFPRMRARDILQKIEMDIINQLQQLSDKDLARAQFSDDLYHAFSLPVVKLLLYYGANPVHRDAETGNSPINGIVRQAVVRGEDFKTGLTHTEMMEWYNSSNNETWPNTLPSDTAINLTRLYVALGETIHKTDDTRSAIYDPLWLSLYDEVTRVGYKLILRNAIGDARRVEEKYPWDTEYDHSYYTSPVTDWIQNFITRRHDAHMLDTHFLLYPRFMKTASVEEIVDILNNPETLNTPVINSNCPYRGADIESGVMRDPDPEATCPLTPHINMRDAMGRTPLHIARMTGNDAVYYYLIAQGADTSIKDFRGNLATSLVKGSYKTYKEKKLELIEQYFKAIADIPLSPSVKSVLPEFREAMAHTEITGEWMRDKHYKKFLPLYLELEKYEKLGMLPTRTKANIKYYGHRDLIWFE